MVRFFNCGDQSLSCGQYFKKNNYQNMTGMKYEDSWLFNLTAGYNNFTLNKNNVYKQGSMVLIEFPVTANIFVSYNTQLNNCDYAFIGNETNFNLINPFQATSLSNKWSFCLWALTTRALNNQEQTYEIMFNQSGNFELVVTVSDNTTKQLYYQAKYPITGKIIFKNCIKFKLKNL